MRLPSFPLTLRPLAPMALLGMSAILAACGGGSPAAAPSVSPAASASVSSGAGAYGGPATSPSAAPASASSSPAAAPSSVSPSAAVSASASSSPAAGQAVPAGGMKLTVAPDSGQMDINMVELLAGNAAKTSAVESTKAVSGTILLDSTGAVLPGSRITMDLSALKSDRTQRDNFIKRSVLQVSEFPNVEFTPTEIQGLNGLPPASGQASFKILGNATVHGVTKPMTWDVTAAFDPQGARGTATSSFQLTEFGMKPPRVGPVLEVDDNGNLTFNFVCNRSAA